MVTEAKSSQELQALLDAAVDGVVVIDHRFVDIGSANFTPLSHGVYDEINLFADSVPFAHSVEAEIARHCADSRVAESRLPYRKMFSGLDRSALAGVIFDGEAAKKDCNASPISRFRCFATT